MKENKEIPENITTKDSRKIETLFIYWKKLSLRNNFSVKEYVDFCKNNSESLKLFEIYRPYYNDKFLKGAALVCFVEERKADEILKRVSLPESNVMLMKDFARNYIPRFKKHFELAILKSVKIKSPIEDSKLILETIDKVSYRWASGIIISNFIASILIKILKKEKISFKGDDINTLYERIRSKSKNNETRMFMDKNYRRFEAVDKTRNRCAHINEGEPTKKEIEQSINFAKILSKKFR